MQLVGPPERSLWDYLVHHHHYLGRPRIVGEHLRYLAFLQGQVVACLGWASAAFKVSDRDRFIDWDPETRRKNLSGVANNVGFLILPWIRIPHLVSKFLALNLRRLSGDRQRAYGHPLYLAETFVFNDGLVLIWKPSPINVLGYPLQVSYWQSAEGFGVSFYAFRLTHWPNGRSEF